MVRKVLVVLGALAVALGVTFAVSAQAGATGKELSHKAAAAKLRAAGIGWSSSGGCGNRNNPTCTSFSGIKSGTVSGVISFKKASHCKITVTGGTETGHASGTYSHWNGYKVDVAITSCVSNHIKRNYTAIGGSKWRSSSGNVYFNEGNHWDITYY
jgi:hypothetical protein